jgi:predicted protein tyrosine phosphatase
VLQILRFGRGWDERPPLLAHCFAGVSRSSATAWRLRRAAPHADPNRRLVQLADDVLERQGRMVDAVETIGDNGFVAMGRPFDLPARF